MITSQLKDVNVHRMIIPNGTISGLHFQYRDMVSLRMLIQDQDSYYSFACGKTLVFQRVVSACDSPRHFICFRLHRDPRNPCTFSLTEENSSLENQATPWSTHCQIFSSYGFSQSLLLINKSAWHFKRQAQGSSGLSHACASHFAPLCGNHRFVDVRRMTIGIQVGDYPKRAGFSSVKFQYFQNSLHDIRGDVDLK